MEGWSRPLAGWLLIASTMLAVIVVPFLVWGTSVSGWVEDAVSVRTGNAAVGSLIAALLALDIVLPVPSSLLSAAAGYRFGPVVGTLVSWVGMSLGCVIAYGIGSALGHERSQRLVGVRAMERASSEMERKGPWVLAASRPVPVLAEASVLVAGISRMSRSRFLAVTLAANLGVSAAYAWIGAESAEAGSFLAAFVAAVALPIVAAAVARARLGRRRSSSR